MSIKDDKRYYLENADRLEWGFKTGGVVPERAGLIFKQADYYLELFATAEKQ